MSSDDTFGNANRELVETWVGAVLPQAHAAATQLLGDFDVDSALTETMAWITAQFAESGIDVAAIHLKESEVTA